jgi:hypothetical protein
MPEVLAITGLVIATVLYALLVRRRSVMRFGIESMSRALHASNEIALSRLRIGSRPERAERAAETGDWRDGVTLIERRSGQDRRGATDRRRGRGRRAGGDRRRGRLSST